MAPHFQKQMSQKVGIVRTPAVPPLGVAEAAKARLLRPAMPAATTVAAEIFRKRRRERAFMAVARRGAVQKR
jgi:hypothetical protein